MNAFDHVANAIQVALGKLDSEPTNQVVSVAEAIEVLKDAKKLATGFGAAYTSELNALKKQIADMEARSAEKPPAAEKPEPNPFKSDAKHPSQPDKKK